MRKILTSIIILLITISIFQTSYATEEETEPSIQIDFTGDINITQDTKNVTFTIELGEFIEIPQNAMIGYEMILEYDKNIFSEVKVEAQENWIVGYVKSTGRLIGETKTTANPNEAIAKITFTLKENVELGKTTIKLKSGLLTINDDDLDINFEKEKEIIIIGKKEEPKPEQSEKSQYQTNDILKNNNNEKIMENANQKQTQNQDNTITSKILPKTGFKTMAITAVSLIIAGMIFLIKYKSI